MLFALIAVLGFTLGKADDRWLATWGGAGVGIVLGLIILALVPVMPFTEQFARETTPQAYWASPTFKKINRVLSAAWGVAIFAVGLSRVAAAAIDGHTTRRLPETAARPGRPGRDRRLHAEVLQELPGPRHPGRGRRARRVVTVRSRRGRLRPRWQASDTESPDDLAAAFDAYADAVIPALAGHWT